MKSVLSVHFGPIVCRQIHPGDLQHDAGDYRLRHLACAFVQRFDDSQSFQEAELRKVLLTDEIQLFFAFLDQAVTEFVELVLLFGTNVSLSFLKAVKAYCWRGSLQNV